MTVEKVERSIMVDLDSILDTRLTLMFKINKDAIPKILVDGYKFRSTNTFEGIDKDTWDKEWGNRGNDLLVESVITDIPRLLGLYCGMSKLVDVKTPIDSVKSIIVNTFPYKLTNDICKGIAAGLLATLDTEISIEFIRKAPKDIPPNWLGDNISAYICYNYLDYLRHHIENEVMTKEFCPGTMLVCPTLLEEIPPGSTPDDIFKELTDLLVPFIGLEFVPTEHFCGKLGESIDNEVKKISDELDKRAR